MATNNPTVQPTDYQEFLTAWLQATGADKDLGFTTTTTHEKGGVDLRAELVNAGASKALLSDLEKSGINLDSVYGLDATAIKDIKNRINYAIKYQDYRGKTSGPVLGVSDKQYQSSLQNLVTQLQTAGETPSTQTQTRLAGIAGLGKLPRYQALAEWQRQNPTKKISDLGKGNFAKLFGVEYQGDKQYFADLAQAEKELKSTEYKQFRQIDDIRQQQINIQQQALQNYQAAQARVNAPGYAQQTVEQSFAPQQQALESYYNAQPGQTYSQAAQDVGTNEAALGRSGYDRVAANLAFQKGQAINQLEAQKSAARTNLQQFIDVGNPAEALRYGESVGQSAMANRDYYKNSLLAPYAQVFPLSMQNYQYQLTPYTSQMQTQSGPEWYDYALGGLGGLGQLIGGVGQFAAGVKK